MSVLYSYTVTIKNLVLSQCSGNIFSMLIYTLQLDYISMNAHTAKWKISFLLVMDLQELICS